MNLNLYSDNTNNIVGGGGGGCAVIKYVSCKLTRLEKKERLEERGRLEEIQEKQEKHERKKQKNQKKHEKNQEKHERDIQEMQEKHEKKEQKNQEKHERDIQEMQKKHEREDKQKKEERQEKQESQEKQKEDAEEMLIEEKLIEVGHRECVQKRVQQFCPDGEIPIMEAYDKNVNKPRLIRHPYKIDTLYGDTWYGVYTNKKVKYYDTHYSLSGFGKAHKNIIKGQSISPKFTETNGWTECEIRNKEGEWVAILK
jgi:ATPase subunit of ABC transporter with duplicated ATPase domains